MRRRAPLTPEELCRDLAGFENRTHMEETIRQVRSERAPVERQHRPEPAPARIEALSVSAGFLLHAAQSISLREDLSDEARAEVCRLASQAADAALRSSEPEDQWEEEALLLFLVSAGEAGRETAAEAACHRFALARSFEESLSQRGLYLFILLIAGQYTQALELLENPPAETPESRRDHFYRDLWDTLSGLSRALRHGDSDWFEQAGGLLADLEEKCDRLGLYRELWMAGALAESFKRLGRHSLWRVLRAYMPDASISAFIRRSPSVYALRAGQLGAIEAGLLDQKRNFVGYVPSGQGRRFLAELAMVQMLANTTGTCLYVAPDEERAWHTLCRLNDLLAPLGESATVHTAPYGILPPSLEEAVKRQGRVMVLTPDVLDSLIRRDDGFARKCRLVVVDEWQILSEGRSGMLLELSLAWLLTGSLTGGVRVVAFSAVSPDTSVLRDWFGAQRTAEYRFVAEPGQLVRTVGSIAVEPFGPNRVMLSASLNTYPDPALPHWVVSRQFPEHWSSQSSPSEYVLEFFHATIVEFAQQGPVLVCTSSQSEQERLVQRLLRYRQEDKRLFMVAAAVQEAVAGNSLLTRALRRGLAYCHDDTLPEVAQLIADAFRSSLVNVVVATSKQALALEFPAQTVIVLPSVLKDPGFSPAKFAVLANLAAGRPSGPEGHVVVLQDMGLAGEKVASFLFPAGDQLAVRSTIENLADSLKKPMERRSASEIELSRTLDSMGDHLPPTEYTLYGAAMRRGSRSLRAVRTGAGSLAGNQSLPDGLSDAVRNSGLTPGGAYELWQRLNERFRDLEEPLFWADEAEVHMDMTAFMHLFFEIAELQPSHPMEAASDVMWAWFNGRAYPEIAREYFPGRRSLERCRDFIADTLQERAARGLALAARTLLYRYERELHEVEFEAKGHLLALASFVRFGTRSPLAVELLARGFAQREDAESVDSLFRRAVGYYSGSNLSPLFLYWAARVSLPDSIWTTVQMSCGTEPRWRQFQRQLLVWERTADLRTEVWESRIVGYGRYGRAELHDGMPILLYPEQRAEREARVEIRSADWSLLGYVEQHLVERLRLAAQEGKPYFALVGGSQAVVRLCRLL